jgi:hypothetical protein
MTDREAWPWSIRELEKDIQRLLVDFVNTTGCEIESVRVDTRVFANLAVEIDLKKKDGE